MTTQTDGPEILYPQGFDARRESEMEDKGYLNDVTVRFRDGSRFLLNFIDPIRLAQDLECEVESGSPFLAEPSMIVVPTVTEEAIRRAVDGLVQARFFEALKPLKDGGGADPPCYLRSSGPVGPGAGPSPK